MTSMRILCFSLLAVLVGCSGPQPPSYFAPPALKTLQTPGEGQALIYLLRAPHDGANLQVRIASKTIELPPGTYAAIDLPAGIHQLETIERGTFGDRAGAPAMPMELKPGQRLFYYVSSSNGMGMPTFIPTAVGPIVDVGAMTPVRSIAGTRKWEECSELDAQGLMSIAKEIQIR